MDWLFNKFDLKKEGHITGLTKELNVLYILNYFLKSDNNVLVVTNSLYECNMLYYLLSTYTNNVLLFPMDDFLASRYEAVSPDLKIKRLETLQSINKGKWIVVTNLTGYLKFLPSKNEQKNLELDLKVKQTISRDIIINRLEDLGYSRDSIVTATGTYAVRGFIIDIFPTFFEHPVRIEFFGDTIEDIRFFDENTQLSLENIKEFLLSPFKEIVSDNHSSLLDYLSKPMVFYYDYQQIMVGYQKLEEDILEYKKENNTLNIDYMFAIDSLEQDKCIYLDTISNINNNSYSSFEMPNFHGDYELLEKNVLDYLNKGKTVIFCLESDNQIRLIKERFDMAHIVRNGNILNNQINILKQKINQGFGFLDLIVISSYDIEEVHKENIKYRNTLRMGKKINSLQNLEVGDYVVHRAHGIGIYNGVVTLKQQGLEKDFIQINYLDNDKVYIPVEKITSIYKYTDKDGAKPKINKLGSVSWDLKKRQAKKKIQDISKELMHLYAIRNNTKTDKYIDYPLEDLFALEFPYEETKDQKRAIDDVLNDLRSDIPMDRLLCGDVGFGKTEVAMRAIFKTVLNNHQVLYLCPTTILAKQQYNAARARFANYPVEIALLNRFTTSKETKRILSDLKNGKVDILFGTHRILSDDVKCKNLGLLVVDEEQRFGVKHKEKIKKYKNDVNVLTLSATPIPRTLKMAMSGLRDLSIIDTPPMNRYPVQTYVVSENELVVKDALYKEISRGGQAFILYNKVADIEDFASKIKILIPEARVCFAHGKMTKNELDNIMEDFVNQKFDILVCTTIIETGIDIPNANTLIIYDADHFGLSQLYQIRGRVGRGNRIAYAYLLYNKGKLLNELAVKRLQTIKDFTELGSGYRIAMRDLSIRGAGDLLGSEQAGNISAVGLSLYMKMMEEEIAKLQGKEVVEEESDGSSLVNVETHINDDYVSDEDVKIEIHQMINEIDSKETLESTKKVLEDRFGKVTDSMLIYMYEEWFSKLAKKLDITNVTQTNRSISLEIPQNISSKIKGDKLFLEAYNINPNFNLKYVNKRIIISLNIKKEDKHFLYYLVPLLQHIINDVSN